MNWNSICYNSYSQKLTDYKHMYDYLYRHKNLVPKNMTIREFTETFIVKTENKNVESIFDL